MSVIAKLNIRSQTDFGTGRLIELSCVCENDLMAAYATSEEDRLFTKYSPWGEMKLSQPEGWALGNGKTGDEFGPPPAFFVMALAEREHEHIPAPAESYMPDANFPGASAWVFGYCHSILDLGGTRHVEFRGGNAGTIKGRAIEKLNWKMAVDNPGASNQFKPGERYWIVLYAAEKFDRDGAIRAAHGHPDPAPEAEAADEAGS
jgi:hypothetical protein